MEWINIENELPPKGKLVLFIVGETDMYIGVLHHGKFEIWGAGRKPITDMEVTYWRPLPELPNITNIKPDKEEAYKQWLHEQGPDEM